MKGLRSLARRALQERRAEMRHEPRYVEVSMWRRRQTISRTYRVANVTSHDGRTALFLGFIRPDAR